LKEQRLNGKDQDKDKGQTHKDQDKDKDKDEDEDLKSVLKDSLRTRTRINITTTFQLEWLDEENPCR